MIFILKENDYPRGIVENNLLVSEQSGNRLFLQATLHQFIFVLCMGLAIYE